MAVYSFPAVAITDSTATGRSLVTAANQAAARAAIGIDLSEYGLLDSDNTWTGDNTFTQTLSGVAGSFSGTLVSEVGGSQIVYGSYTDASNYERLRTSYDGVQYVIQTEGAGTGVAKRLQLKVGTSVRLAGDSAFTYLYGASGGYIYIGGGYVRPQSGQSIDLGGTSNRWANFYGVDADFSGTVTANAFVGDGSGLTNLPSSNPFDQSLNTTDSPTFVRSYIGDGVRATPSHTFASQTSMGMYKVATNQLGLVVINKGMVITTTSAQVGASSSIGWRAADSIGSGLYDTMLNRDDAGIISQRSTIYGGSQAFRVYGDGDKTNGEWLQMDHGVTTANTATISSVANGSGTLRDLALVAPSINVTGELDCSGTVKSGDGSVTAPSYSFGSQSTMGMYRAANGQINMIAQTGGYGFNLSSNALSVSSNMAFGWRTTTNISQGHSFDTLITRDATGIIAQRNFFNNAAQAYRVYGTWTDASNGEWLQIDHGVTTSNTATISSVANGTGTLRNLALTAPSINVTGELNLDGQTVRGIARFKNIASNWIDIDGSTVGTNVANISSRFSFTVSALSGTLNLTGTSGAALQHSNVTKLATTTTGVTATGDVVTDSTFVINRTWNDAATVFQAYDCNITDTASNSNSNLLNLKVSGVQKFRVKKDGTCTATAFVGDGSGLTGLPSGSSTLAGLTDTNVSSPANGQLLIYDSGTSKWDNANLTSTGGTIAITNGAGTINLENAGGAPSDRRLKGDVESLDDPLYKVLGMLPVKFRWLEGFENVHKQTGNDIGFIAQELENVEKVLVGENRGFKTVNYEKVVPILAGAIKELYLEIEKLKEEA